MNNTEGEENLIFLKDNKVKYLQDNILVTSSSQQFFNGTWKPAITFTYNTYLANGYMTGEPIIIGKGHEHAKYSDTVLVRFYGTITRDNTADNTAFYILDNAGPQNDNGAIIPVNPYTNVTTFDFVTICHRSDGSWYYVYLWFKTLGRTYNTINTPCTLNLKIDYTAL